MQKRKFCSVSHGLVQKQSFPRLDLCKFYTKMVSRWKLYFLVTVTHHNFTAT